jgi:hypothetical protein
MKMHIKIALAMAALIGLASPCFGAEVGRYQEVALPQPENQLASKVVILDTATGDLWEWAESPNAGGAPVGGTFLTYMGRMAVGPVGKTVVIKRNSN